MKPQWRKFAPFGLYLAGAAALVTIGLFIVFQEFGLPVQIGLGVAILGLAVATILDPQRAREFFLGRQVRYGSNALVVVLATLGIIIAVNWIGNANSQRWDLTENKDNTLSSETLDTLARLSQPVKADAYFTIRTPSDSARQTLEKYKVSSKGKFDYNFIDPEADPIAAQNAKITRDGTVVLKLGDQSQQVTTLDEQEITSAIIRLSNPGKRAVYFLTGHGEAGIESNPDRISYANAKQILETKNYTVQSLNLLSTPAIPDDALVIVIAGPKKPLSQAEVALLKGALDKGKGIVYLSDPLPLTNFGADKDPMAEYLAAEWGISLDNDLVVDPNVNPPSVAVADSYGQHPITTKMVGNAALFPTTRSLSSLTQTVEGASTTPLAQTAQNAWGETDFAALQSQQVSFDAAKDVPGPITLAMAGENSTSKARLVVTGDSEFASDLYFTQYGNGDFLINSIDWAASQDNLINLTPKANTTRTMVAPEITTMGLILLGSIFLIPGLIIILGISVWIQRRRRG